MASHKLTVSRIDALLAKLDARVETYSKRLFLGLGGKPFSVRALCEDAGISRTTYYRWLREYRRLVAKQPRSEREKLLRRFGDAVEAAYQSSAEVGVGMSVLRAAATRVNVPESRRQPQVSSVSSEVDISAIESKTDALTGGIRCVEFRVKDSLKNM